jgi:hypothetical protein
LVLAELMAEAGMETTQFPQRRVVTQLLARSQQLVEATAAPEAVTQPMAAVAAVAVGIILVNESLWELQVKETLVDDPIKIVTEPVAVAAAQVALAPMRLRNILEAPEALEFRQQSQGLLFRTAVAVVVALMPTAVVFIQMEEALEALAVAVMAAALATAAAHFSTARRALPILAAVVVVLTQNQVLRAMADQELLSCVTLLLRYQQTLVCQPLVVLHALAQH